MHQQIPPHPMPQQYMIPENYKIEKMTSSKKRKQEKKSKFKEICSMSTLRRIVIITILYNLPLQTDKMPEMTLQSVNQTFNSIYYSMN